MERFVIFRGMSESRGFSIVFMALAMFAICGLVGLCLDIAYSYLVKGQLQTAADAGALAGAGVIYPDNTVTLTQFPKKPLFGKAKAAAQEFVKKNKAAGALLEDSEIENIEAGYWNLGHLPVGMQPTSIVPAGKCSGSGLACTSNAGCAATESCMIQDVPAVSVTVRKTVPTFFAKVVGVRTLEPRATAIAARGFPRSGRPFPIAVSKCMVDDYFAQDPLPNPPIEVIISGAYSRVANCNTGQWTSLARNSNSAEEIRDLMDGTPARQDIGDDIHIAIGNMESLYIAIRQNFLGQVVLLPVVQDPVLNTNSRTPIAGFVRFRIGKVIGEGASSQIAGHFLAYYSDRDAVYLGGPAGNTVTPPALVK